MQKVLPFNHPTDSIDKTTPRTLCNLRENTRDDCSTSSRCCPINCRGPHSALYQGCPVYKFECEVTALRRRCGLSLRQAKGFHPGPSSADVTKSVHMSTLATTSASVVSSLPPTLSTTILTRSAASFLIPLLLGQYPFPI
ncbi:hypothetical protein Pcinc_005213 [Petrolisthes cinctipes]|uniref:Uncharacterized protein n=1 Tax=Petrolisthes cinctipes TaxID=88211 RepID=A0AAE1GFK4_PETCI|nr:hypothetical protein Pcinc_005213 [Petrolisthes cinctipes]